MNQNTKKSDKEMLQWSSTPGGVGSKSGLDATSRQAEQRRTDKITGNPSYGVVWGVLTQDYKEMYGDFSDFKKSYDFLMKLEINVPYLLVVVSCQVPCVDLKPLPPVSGVELTGGEGRERLFQAAFFVAIGMGVLL